jgi:hypothetical protein
MEASRPYFGLHHFKRLRHSHWEDQHGCVALARPDGNLSLPDLGWTVRLALTWEQEGKFTLELQSEEEQ